MKGKTLSNGNIAEFTIFPQYASTEREFTLKLKNGLSLNWKIPNDKPFERGSHTIYNIKTSEMIQI